MKLFIRILASLLLLFNGVGALYGGGALILHPDGSALHISTDWLRFSPFHDFMIPGIVLFLFNGASSIVILVLLIAAVRRYPLAVIAQGAILLGWIVIQVLMVRSIVPLHIIMGSTGLLLLISGGILLLLQKNR